MADSAPAPQAQTTPQAQTAPLTNRRIFAFWSPLAATWAIMGVEVPIVSFTVANLADATANLAALGAAVAIAWLSETAIVNLTATSLRLARDRESYLRIRRYGFLLCVLAGVMNVILVATPALEALLAGPVGMTPELAALTVKAYGWLAPWPVLIGLRRLWQGQMIRQGDTRRVAYGTGVRLVVLTGAAAIFSQSPWLTGAEVGAVALLCGIASEAVAARLLARPALARTLATAPEEPPPTWSEFWAFYWPLTVMMGLNLAVGSLVTAGLAKSEDAAVALAAFPVAHGINFVARAIVTSYQEAAIAFLGARADSARQLAAFAMRLGLAMTVVLALIAATPAAGWLFSSLMDLPPALLEPARACFLALLPYPAVTLWFMWTRARLTHLRRTGPIATATVFETVALIAIMAVLIGPLDVAGATAAGLALVASRVLANLWVEWQAKADLAALSKIQVTP